MNLNISNAIETISVSLERQTFFFKSREDQASFEIHFQENNRITVKLQDNKLRYEEDSSFQDIRYVSTSQVVLVTISK